MVPWPSWLRRGANNAKISSSILLGTISFFALWMYGLMFGCEEEQVGVIYIYFTYSKCLTISLYMSTNCTRLLSKNHINLKHMVIGDLVIYKLIDFYCVLSEHKY